VAGAFLDAATGCLALDRLPCLFWVCDSAVMDFRTALGRELRIDEALGDDHQLIRSGPYAVVRNPIYTSMLLVDCAIAVVITPWQLFIPSLLLFILGTEIRVRTEEMLLSGRFGEEFRNYKYRVPAYLPFLY
jgi:protein-S-isoprenylcysteine O-methyltransferase Ste14